jgi:hypothetical protein
MKVHLKSRYRLNPASRINYAKIYTVEHNIKVSFIGLVAQECQGTLMKDFDEAWSRKKGLEKSKEE